ncbi:unnamed protein product, partial [Ectocarpus sp. 12 AP-2014]
MSSPISVHTYTPQTDHIYLSKMEGKAWTCDSVTISYASPRGTNRCRSCKLHMESGAIRFGMIFKCSSMSTMLFQGFHLQCVQAPSFLTSIELLEGIEDISPSDVAIIERWIETGVA